MNTNELRELANAVNVIRFGAEPDLEDTWEAREERIQLYASRAAQRLPLFEASPMSVAS